MKNKCALCKITHDDSSWKTIFDDSGELVTFCSKYFKPSPMPEYVPNRIKDERMKYLKDTIQPFRKGDNTLSSEWVKANPKQAAKYDKETIRKAKPIWSDVKEIKSSKFGG